MQNTEAHSVESYGMCKPAIRVVDTVDTALMFLAKTVVEGVQPSIMLCASLKCWLGKLGKFQLSRAKYSNATRRAA